MRDREREREISHLVSVERDKVENFVARVCRVVVLIDNFTGRSQFDSGDDLEICDEFIISIGRKKKRGNN